MQHLQEATRAGRERAAARAATPTRAPSIHPPRLVMIGASTGGPQALLELLETIQPAAPFVSIALTLHMPPDLMPIIAAHVARICHVQTRVVTSAMPLEKGIVYFSPGDRHIGFAKVGASLEIAPASSRQRDVCKPAIDKMFASGAAAMGAQALGVVLSGMGTDGLAGARAIVAAGGSVLVQNRETSAVWGMPGAVAKAELASGVFAPNALGREVIRRLRLEEPRR